MRRSAPFAAAVILLSLSACVDHFRELHNPPSSIVPGLSFEPDEVADKLKVNSASAEADWSRLTVSTLNCQAEGGPIAYIGGYPGRDHVNVMPSEDRTVIPQRDSVEGCGVEGALYMARTFHQVQAGDFLAFCTNHDNLPGFPVTLEDSRAHQVVFSYTFFDIASCF